MKIENKQLHERVDEKNTQLLELKLSAGKTMQTLNYYKTKVSGMSADSKRLDDEIAQRQELLSKIETESELVTIVSTVYMYMYILHTCTVHVYRTR